MNLTILYVKEISYITTANDDVLLPSARSVGHAYHGAAVFRSSHAKNVTLSTTEAFFDQPKPLFAVYGSPFTVTCYACDHSSTTTTISYNITPLSPEKPNLGRPL